MPPMLNRFVVAFVVVFAFVVVVAIIVTCIVIAVFITGDILLFEFDLHFDKWHRRAGRRFAFRPNQCVALPKHIRLTEFAQCVDSLLHKLWAFGAPSVAQWRYGGAVSLVDNIVDQVQLCM